jgi:hypothetical protein
VKTDQGELKNLNYDVLLDNDLLVLIESAFVITYDTKLPSLMTRERDASIKTLERSPPDKFCMEKRKEKVWVCVCVVDEIACSLN